MTFPINGAPMTIMLGVNDKSTRPKVFELAPRAIHVPLVFLWSQWGPLEPQKVFGSTREALYGDNTFDMRSKYANHATLYANLFSQKANPMLVKRLRPIDAPDPANIRLCLDVLETTDDEYERNVDGSFVIGPDGKYVTTGEKVPVLSVKFVTEYINPKDNINQIGKGQILTGDQVKEGATSHRYPIFDYELPYFGSNGNNYGFRIWAPTANDNNPINTTLLDKDKVFPFRFSFAKKIANTTSSNIIVTNNSEPYIDFVLKPGMVDTANDMERYLGDILSDNYQDLTPSEGFPVNKGPFGRFYIYQNNIDLILTKLFDLESVRPYSANELNGMTAEEGKYLVNIFGGTTSQGIPYQSYRFAPLTAGAVRPSEYTTIYATGGGDGTMTTEIFDKMVGEEISLFADENSEWQDIIGRPCSFFWDSGFSMETKYKLGKFISLRKNNILMLSTYVDGEPPLTAGEESARVVSLATRVRSYSESDYFGTPAFRFSVCAQSGKLIGQNIKKRVSLSYELAGKVCDLANSSNFKSTYLFNQPGNNEVVYLTDLNNGWVPAKVRNKDWANGMLWAERLEERKFYIPAARTGYKDDTSVLTSLTLAIVIAELETIGDEIRRKYSGSELPIGILLSNVEEDYKKATVGKFAELYTIEPKATQTASDEKRGYSYTLTVKVYGNTPKTVMTLIIESHRSDELTSDNINN